MKSKRTNAVSDFFSKMTASEQQSYIEQRKKVLIAQRAQSRMRQLQRDIELIERDAAMTRRMIEINNAAQVAIEFAMTTTTTRAQMNRIAMTAIRKFCNI